VPSRRASAQPDPRLWEKKSPRCSTAKPAIQRQPAWSTRRKKGKRRVSGAVFPGPLALPHQLVHEPQGLLRQEKSKNLNNPLQKSVDRVRIRRGVREICSPRFFRVFLRVLRLRGFQDISFSSERSYLSVFHSSAQGHFIHLIQHAPAGLEG